MRHRDTFVVQVDLAGMDPTQIEVLADEHSLLVRGIRRESSGARQETFPQDGNQRGTLQPRRVPITVDVDPASATATYRNGFLFVTFQKGHRAGT